MAAPTGRPSPEARLRFFRTLAVMNGAGLPLDRALDFLSNDPDGDLSAVSQALRNQVMAGKSLTQAMQICSGAFSAFQTATLSVGERNGRMSETLTQLAEAEEARLSIRMRLRSALLQPVVLLAGTLVGMVLFLPLFVFPAYLQLVESLEIPVQGAFGVFIRLMKFTQGPTFWIPCIGGLALTIYVLSSSLHRELLCRSLLVSLRTVPGLGPYFQGVYGRGRSWEALLAGGEALLLVSPLANSLGRALQCSFSARFASAFASQLDAGISALEAMRPAIQASGSGLLQIHQGHVEAMLKEGNSVSVSIATAEVLPGLFTQLLYVGEQVGKLPELCHKAADFYQDEFSYTLETALALLEPVVLAIMGITMGACAVFMLYPMVQVVNAL